VSGRRRRLDSLELAYLIVLGLEQRQDFVLDVFGDLLLLVIEQLLLHIRDFSLLL